MSYFSNFEAIAVRETIEEQGWVKATGLQGMFADKPELFQSLRLKYFAVQIIPRRKREKIPVQDSRRESWTERDFQTLRLPCRLKAALVHGSQIGVAIFLQE
jgi:hypothetical protein